MKIGPVALAIDGYSLKHNLKSVSKSVKTGKL